MKFENSLALGNGIYTLSDVSRILRLPYYQVHKWVTKYWDNELGLQFQQSYSWVIDDNNRAVSFHTLIEIYVFIQFSESGVRTRDVLNAHKELSTLFGTPFPFATKRILDNLRTDGKTVFIQHNGGTVTLDGTRQFNLELIKIFFKNLDFDRDALASRFWPLGKGRNILIDPKRQFGHPVLGKSNIYPETIYNLHKSGESIDFISFTYEIEEQLVKDAIEYCEAA